MPRYRVGNSYLSEKEYEEHISSSWGGWLFIFFSIASGSYAYKLIDKYTLTNHNLRFVLIISAMVLGGILGYKFRNIIRSLFFLAIFIGISVSIFKLIYSLV